MTDFRFWVEEDGTCVYLHSASDGDELAAVEADIRETAVKDGTIARAVYGANAMDDERSQFLVDNGYERAFSLVSMELDDLTHLPDVSIPSDFELRSATSEDLRTLWELNNVAYEGREFTPIATETGFEDFVHDMGDLSLTTVAQYGTEAAGFVGSEIRNHLHCAYVNEVTVHPDYRRRGLASAMLSTNLTWVRERGINRARLHTNGENISGGRSLYESFGFKVFETHIRFRKPLPA